MKKKALAVFLAAAVSCTMGAPAYGAEFSSPEESADVFSAGNETGNGDEEVTSPEEEESENEETLVSNEEELLTGTTDDDDDEDEDDDDEEEKGEKPAIQLEILKQPDITSYVYGVEARDISEFDFSGMTIKTTYPLDEGDYYDLDSEELKIDTDDFSYSKSCWVMEDSYSNRYEISIWYNGSQVKTHENEGTEYQPLTAGEYTVKITASDKSSISTSIWIKEAENMPVLKQYEEGKYSVSASTSTSWKYAKITPEEDGVYLFSGTGRNFEWGNGYGFKLCDASMNVLQQENTNGDFTLGIAKYKLQKGKEYYLSYKTGTEVTEIEYKAEMLRDIISLEMVEQPYENTYYISAKTPETWKPGKFRLYDMFGGKIKVTYSNGESEILPCYAKNKYADRLVPFIEWSGEGNPKAGTYDLHFSYENSETELIIKNGAVIKDYPSMPGINKKGKVTVPVSMTGATDAMANCRLVTGNDSRYIINSSPFFVLSASIDLGGGKTQWAGLLSNGVNALKPNSVYYICAQSNGMEKLLDGTALSDVKTNTFTAKPEKGKLSNCTVVISETKYLYTGKAIKPYYLEVVEGNSQNRKTTLREGVHYTVSYKDNIKCGTATITIKGKGSYSGTLKKTFKIYLPKPNIKSVKKSGSSDIKVTWAKTKGASGYEVYKLTGKTWKKISDTKSTSFTDKGLKKNTTYQYKIRAYQTVKGKKVYSALSSVKKIKR